MDIYLSEKFDDKIELPNGAIKSYQSDVTPLKSLVIYQLHYKKKL